MPKNIHEIRDPIHIFIRLDSDERQVLDSRPFQRLRYIHQLAMTYLVYPGATHKRFEHSLGVMELASRVFDVITREDKIDDNIKTILPELSKEDALRYWKRVLRMAALCHDIGHLPFSHTAEKDLLPEGWDHEHITRELILSDEMKQIWNNLTPPLRPEDVVKLALGPKKAPDLQFSDWETILAEIIVGDIFGVDRIDYLLRDSYHVGVAYGKFDHYRLIDTLRILPPPPLGDEEQSTEPMLGIEEGGIQSAESLLLARYFMYSQVYFHPVRRIYDIHLKDFLREWLEGEYLPIEINKHLLLTDNEIISALRESCSDPSKKGHEHSIRVIKRKHFKLLYPRNPEDMKINANASEVIYISAKNEFGENKVRWDKYIEKGGAPDFPVLAIDGRVVSSLLLSKILKQVPIAVVDYVYIDPTIRNKVLTWLKKNRTTIITKQKGECDE